MNFASCVSLQKISNYTGLEMYFGPTSYWTVDGPYQMRCPSKKKA